MKRLTLILALLSLAPALAACGEKSEKIGPTSGARQSVTLMLDWFPNADHVGLYQAIAEGDFTSAGLNVNVQTPSNPAAPLQLLAAGQIDAAISYEPELLLARNQNEPLVSVAAIVQKPLTSIISLGSKHIKKPSDLRGKRVGDAGISYQHAYLTTILGQAGVPSKSVKEVNVGENLVPDMISGKVDATLGGYWNYEAIQLQRMGKRPNVIPVNQAGIPTYDELVLVVRQSELTKRPDVIRRLVQALGRGYESARRNPQAAVQNLVRLNSGLDQGLELQSVEATLPAFFPAGNHPWGYQDPNQWSAFGQWMLQNHLISNQNALVDPSTNELLAGQGI